MLRVAFAAVCKRTVASAAFAKYNPQQQLASLRQSAYSSVSPRLSSPFKAVAAQQFRHLLAGKGSPVNRQIHKPKPAALGRKIKTPGIVKRRVILKNGEYIRYQAGRRHKRTKKPKGQLRALKKTVPLFKAYARKLKKLGYSRSWWWTTR